MKFIPETHCAHKIYVRFYYIAPFGILQFPMELFVAIMTLFSKSFYIACLFQLNFCVFQLLLWSIMVQFSFHFIFNFVASQMSFRCGGYNQEIVKTTWSQFKYKQPSSTDYRRFYLTRYGFWE